MKAIHILFIIILTFFTNTCLSQDIITLKNGDEVESKVISISNTEIHYKKLSNLAGPTYIINKDAVFMIKYENGEKDVFNLKKEIDNTSLAKKKDNFDSLELSIRKGGKKGYYLGGRKVNKTDFYSVLKTNTSAYEQYQFGKGLKASGLIIGIPAGFFLGYGLGTNADAAIIAVSGVGVLGSIILEVVGQNHIIKSLEKYNKNILSNFNVIFTNTGVGLAYSF